MDQELQLKEIGTPELREQLIKSMDRFDASLDVLCVLLNKQDRKNQQVDEQKRSAFATVFH